MSAPALSVRGLGKRYSLGLTHAGSLQGVASRWTRRLRGLPPADAPVDAAPGAEPTARRGEFWALKDVNFEVQPGEVVGVIGRNGAGKSTLLKVLSRVTSPTTGEVRVRGRVGSLLEVGTGFHPELTGRENIYMNATLLGMSKREVRARLDEIVEFSGVERFLDTPVKRYSSGMKVRLGFAVAAHLEPEVLIVDEVLSVGDAEFQKKCLGKMQDVAGEGRTVLFVSHHMAAVRTLCPRSILLKGGRVSHDLATDRVVREHLAASWSGGISGLAYLSPPPGAPIWMESVEVVGVDDDGQLEYGDPLRLMISYASTGSRARPAVGLVVKDANGTALINANTHYQALEGDVFDRGTVDCDLGKVPFMAGRYSVDLYFGDATVNYHVVEGAVAFEFVACDIWGGAKLPPPVSSMYWNTQFTVKAYA